MPFGRVHHSFSMFLAALLAVGLSSASVRAEDAPAGVIPARGVAFGPVSEPAYAVAGRPLIVPIEPQEPAGPFERLAPDRLPDVRINGVTVQDVSCSLLFPSGNATSSAWDPETRQWSAAPLGTSDKKGRTDGPAKDAAEPGIWCVVFDIPAGLERPIVTLNTKSVPLIWLDPPPPVTGSGRPVRPVASAESWRNLGERLRPIARDPQQRWRVRLLIDRVTAQELWPQVAPEAFADRALEAWAARQEECWRSAIEDVRRVDPVLSSDLLHALSAVVALPGGTLVPAWPMDEIGTQRLLRSLLDPAETRSRKAEYVRAWLASIPDAVAWVIDDADADGPTLGVAELSGRRTNISLRFSAAPDAVRRTLLAHESISVRLPRPVLADDEPTSDLGTAEVSAEGWNRRLSLLTKPAPIKPPGLLTGPFLRPCTHASWLSGTPAPAIGPLATTALLQPGAVAGEWQLFVQCAPTPSGAAQDRVNAWFGPFGDPDVVISIDRFAASTLNLRGKPAQAIDVPISTADAGWSALVHLPAEAVDKDGLVRLGLDRLVSEDRSSWPRPMLPGQVEPGRVAVDLTTWGSLSGN